MFLWWQTVEKQMRGDEDECEGESQRTVQSRGDARETKQRFKYGEAGSKQRGDRARVLVQTGALDSVVFVAGSSRALRRGWRWRGGDRVGLRRSRTKLRRRRPTSRGDRIRIPSVKVRKGASDAPDCPEGTLGLEINDEASVPVAGDLESAEVPSSQRRAEPGGP